MTLHTLHALHDRETDLWTDGQTDRQTPRTSVPIVCIICIQCSLVIKTSGQSNLTKAGPNDPAHMAHSVHCTHRCRFKSRDRQTDIVNIGNNILHLMHLMQRIINGDECAKAFMIVIVSHSGWWCVVDGNQ